VFEVVIDGHLAIKLVEALEEHGEGVSQLFFGFHLELLELIQDVDECPHDDRENSHSEQQDEGHHQSLLVRPRV